MTQEDEITQKVAQHNQQHLLTFWDSLTTEERAHLKNELAEINFDHLDNLQKQVHNISRNYGDRLMPPEHDACESLEEMRSNKPDALDAYYSTALENIQAGKVAVLLLAGGQGTRLGVSYPKGMYRPNLPSGKSLFQLQAERILRVRHLTKQVYGSLPRIPWYIMTSDHTCDTTVAFFKEHKYFGHDERDVIFFEQFTLPVLSLDGKLMLEDKHKVCRAPDGNGGLYLALQRMNILDDMRARGVEYVQVYCVDNILIKLPDLHFIGFCISRRADCGAEVVEKVQPNEPIGVVGVVDGKYRVVEYSEISPETAALRRPCTNKGDQVSEQGDNDRLVYSHGNICVHLMTVEFLQRVCTDSVQQQMIHHVAKKRVPYLDVATGTKVIPDKPNAIKMEKFIFDVFPFAKSFAIWEVVRSEQFSPLKNGLDATKDCPATCRADLLAYDARLAKLAGAVFATVPDTKQSNNGNGVIDEGLHGYTHSMSSVLKARTVLEISPLVSYAGENLECLNGKLIDGVNVLEVHEQDAIPVLKRLDNHYC